MKFTEQKLFKIHKALQSLNKLDMGEYHLPDRMGLVGPSGDTEAIVYLDGDRYSIELIEEAILKAHLSEVEEQDEVEEKS